MISQILGEYYWDETDFEEILSTLSPQIMEEVIRMTLKREPFIFRSVCLDICDEVNFQTGKKRPELLKTHKGFFDLMKSQIPKIHEEVVAMCEESVSFLSFQKIPTQELMKQLDLARQDLSCKTICKLYNEIKDKHYEMFLE